MLLHLLHLTLDLHLARHQLRQLRGRVAEWGGWQHDLLHNHRDGQPDRYHYRYPLVQYKVVKGQATLLGLQAGADLLRSLVDADTLRFADQLPVANCRQETHRLRLTDTPQRYMLRQWLALNSPNYTAWDALRHQPAAQRALLERVLAAHLLAFAEGVGYTVPRPRGLTVRLDELWPPRRVCCHDNALLSFDASFETNLALPAEVGLGKAAAHGFGVTYGVPARRAAYSFLPREAGVPNLVLEG